MAYEITDRDIFLSKTKEKNLKIFWGGFILYQLSFSLTTTLIYFNIVQLQLLQFSGIAVMVYGSLNIIKFKIKNGYLNFIYIIYLLWMLSIIARGFKYDLFSIKETLVDPGFGILIYFVPLFLLFPANFTFYRQLFWVINLFAIFYFIYSLSFVKHLIDPDRESNLSKSIVENFSTLSFCSAFTLMTYIYHPKMRKLLAFGAVFATLLFAVYRARRGLILMTVVNLMSILVVYLIVTKRTIMVLYVVILAALIGYFYYSSLYNQKNFGIFNFLVERGNEDTRTGVEDAMKDDMSSTDWIWGKGFDGEYYCPNIDDLDTRGYRAFVETGFLQIMLKGGIGSLALLLLILIPAMWQGITKGKNIFSKACGIWILLAVLYMYPTVGNSFMLSYITVWICVGVCFNPAILRMTDAEVADALNPAPKSSTRKRTRAVMPGHT